MGVFQNSNTLTGLHIQIMKATFKNCSFNNNSYISMKAYP